MSSIIKKESKEMSPINRRGVPARIRKKNKLFYDNEMITFSPKYFNESDKSITSTSPKKPNILTSNRKIKVSKELIILKHTKIGVNKNPPVSKRVIGEKIGPKLRNLLKLPQAHKWVCYEWFYSDIDRCLFLGSNDFELCLKETFPGFNCRKMTRVQWTIIRRMLGKPRRCSASFFREEREDLEQRRNKIRALQQSRQLDSMSFTDLPAQIPMQLTIGTKVTARLRRPQNGLFTGTVNGYDTLNNMYRIIFDRPDLGSLSSYDYEVLSDDPVEFMLVQDKKNVYKGTDSCSGIDSFLTKEGTRNICVSKSKASENRLLNGYPIKLLELIVLVTKLLSDKKWKIRRLKELNNAAEKYNSYGGDLSDDYERTYASVMIKLDKLNRDLQNYLLQIRVLCTDLVPKSNFISMLIPNHIQERSHSEAMGIVSRYLRGRNTRISDSNLELIKNLTKLLIIVRTISNFDRNAFNLSVLQAAIEQIKNKLSPCNQDLFENCVEIHMRQIINDIIKNNPPIEF